MHCGRRAHRRRPNDAIFVEDLAKIASPGVPSALVSHIDVWKLTGNQVLYMQIGKSLQTDFESLAGKSRTG